MPGMSLSVPWTGPKGLHIGTRALRRQAPFRIATHHVSCGALLPHVI
jgi:hypothetical protein